MISRRQSDTHRSGFAAVWGAAVPTDRAPRVLGLFAHPDDEVFCVGGTIARCAAAGAATAIVSLTQGEAGQIRDAAAATRRTLGTVRVAELARAGDALGVDRVTCLDLGDGGFDRHPPAELAAAVRSVIDGFRPDVVVTFGPDGATGHADHVASCHATVEAIRTMAQRPRLLHARFPMQEQLMLDVIVAWLTSKDQRFSGTAAFGHALKLFADGSSMLGFAADHFDVEWFPAGSSPSSPTKHAAPVVASLCSAPSLPSPTVGFAVDVRAVLDRKVSALAAHRSQYALDSNLLPRSVLECLLGTERPEAS